MLLYMMHIEEAQRVPEEICHKLFPLRFERSGRFLKREDALRCIAAGLLLSAITGVEENEITYNEWGKPLIKGKAISVAHSGNYALLAVESEAVGLDIERESTTATGIAERVFTPDEIAWMKAVPEQRFLELWTMKESVLKLDGRGLSMPMKSFSVVPLLEGDTIELECGEIYGRTTGYDGHVISVCGLQPIDAFELRMLTAEDIVGDE